MFICFTGIDGSGKSTLAHMLVAELAAHGVKSHYAYSRFRPRLIKPLAAIGHALFLRNQDVYQDYSGYSATRKALFRNRFLAFAYENILLFDYCLQTILRVRIPLARGQSLICDRYVYDTVITDLAADMGYSADKINRMLRRCFLMLPRPEFVFLIDVPEEVAFARKEDVPSVDYLKDRQQLYLKIDREHDIIVLDGTKDIPSLVEEIAERVLK